MEFRVRLVHADAQRRVVRVGAFEGDHCLGSALGEASNAEEAEDRARDRLLQRLSGPDAEARHRHPPAAAPPPKVAPPAAARPPQTFVPSVVAPAPVASSAPKEVAPPVDLSPPADGDRIPPASRIAEAHEPREPLPEPEDWSADLTQLDRLLGTLGWGRDEERIYVRRLFGQSGRSRLTRHADLMVLRRALEALPPGSPPDSAPLPLLRSELLAQCDALLASLCWTTERARQCLEGHFAVNSRQRLSDDQLLAFNLLLEGELIGQSELGEQAHA